MQGILSTNLTLLSTWGPSFSFSESDLLCQLSDCVFYEKLKKIFVVEVWVFSIFLPIAPSNISAVILAVWHLQIKRPS